MGPQESTREGVQHHHLGSWFSPRRRSYSYPRQYICECPRRLGAIMPSHPRACKVHIDGRACEFACAEKIAAKPPLRKGARVALMDSRNRTKNGARFSASAQQQQHSMDNILWSPIPIPFLARPPPHDPDARPPALPRVHSHTLRPRQRRVPKESDCGLALRRKRWPCVARSGGEHRLIKDEIVSCARHAKSESAK